MRAITLGNTKTKQKWEFILLEGFVTKLKGLLGTRKNTKPVWLIHCSSVHTLGMVYPIDIAFLSDAGYIVRVERGVVPNRVLSCPGAHSVLERPSESSSWPALGDRLWPLSVRKLTAEDMQDVPQRIAKMHRGIYEASDTADYNNTRKGE